MATIKDDTNESNDPEHVEGPTYEKWFVCMCVSRAGHYYVGMSTNPQKRLLRHNTGHGSKMAVDQGPFKLLYISTPFATKSQARAREEQLKKWSRIKKEKLITGEWK